MNDSPEAELAQVRALDEERRRYEQWLAQLDTRRGAAPEHVLQRVRTDYEARLRDVMQRLSQHAEMLRAEVAERAREVAALRDAERQRQDERAEAELRATVGELNEAQWQEISGRTDLELRELGDRRRTAEAELSRLDQVLAMSGHESKAGPGRGDGRDLERVQLEGERLAQQDGGLTTPRGGRDVTIVGGGAGAGQGRGSTAAPTSAAQSPRDPEPGGQQKTLRCGECGTMNYPTEWYCERCGGELAAT